MCKKGLRHFLNPKCITIGFVILCVLGVYKYLIQSQCVNGMHCSAQKRWLTELQRDNNVDTNESMTNKCSSKVNVNVNYKDKFVGLKINNELYVPFKFLKKYYEVSGEFISEKSIKENEFENKINTVTNTDDDVDNFLWLHISKSDLDPRNLRHNPYTSYGMYLNFKDSDVANRARVKCICGKYEVPITTQWDAKGYYYPTQIAQYGLSHLSKHFGENVSPKKLKLKIKKGLSGKFSASLNIKELKIVKIKMVQKLSSFSVKVIASDQNIYLLQYVKDNSMVSRVGKTIIHGLGDHLHKNEIIRDLQVDLIKGLSFREGKRQGNTVSIYIKKIDKITFQNIQYVLGVRFTNVDHVSMFLAAADWFIHFQDAGGGWKTNVSRVIFKGVKREAGWYSSMGQGQALSLLSRVYKFTGKTKYLQAALKATNVFNIPSSKDGVLSLLFGKYPWYEEYPVTPPLHVLNGFIYSLFGLYDLSKAASEKDGIESQRLFTQGLSSLETLLPLFDNGHGTFYDLRHISVPGQTPNRARWQYHRVHLEQLFAIVDITKSVMINKTLSRWIAYASGVPARHN